MSSPLNCSNWRLSDRRQKPPSCVGILKKRPFKEPHALPRFSRSREPGAWSFASFGPPEGLLCTPSRKIEGGGATTPLKVRLSSPGWCERGMVASWPSPCGTTNGLSRLVARRCRRIVPIQHKPCPCRDSFLVLSSSGPDR